MADQTISSGATDALRTEGLGKRYGRRWALRDCSFALPAGRMAALVGPNGAGKTTLLHLAMGLLQPTAGFVRVYDAEPWKQPMVTLPRIGFVAQDHPLYRGFTVADTLTFGERMNRRWDGAFAASRMRRLGIPLDQRVGKLSGGQQAQVALALALAKRPDVLLLDEPVASLDPLARREFLRTLVDSAQEHGITTLLSSHIVGDLEQACDYLIILSASRVQLAGDIPGIMRTHQRLVGPRGDRAGLEGIQASWRVIEQTLSRDDVALLVRADEAPLNGYDAGVAPLPPGWRSEGVSLEAIVLAYLSLTPDGMSPDAATAVAQQRMEVSR